MNVKLSVEKTNTAAYDHALEVLGQEQFDRNKPSVEAIVSDFISAVQWADLAFNEELEDTATGFAKNVQQMRHAQKSYFVTIASAKKTGAPETYAMANNYLKESKRLEIVVDQQVAEILGEEEPNA
ncbi:MAG TPA: hypothetical protein VGM41_08290 [Chitinophagaceae bacterium]|jgi:hypothetical protein